MRILPIIGFLIIFGSCKEETKELTAQQIVDKTIDNAGGDKYKSAAIQFSFRDIKYSSRRNNGDFEFTRTIVDSLGETRDVLTNNSFERYANGTKLSLADSTVNKYSNSVNSVHYFVQLPYGLNDAAVNKKLVGESKINGKDYYEIQVTFSENGGGTDHEDVYMYWIAKEDFTVDYLAYKFYTGKGGIRFRKAVNPRIINGLRFVDYENYKIEPWKSVEMQTLGELFEANELTFLSEINTEDISVKPIKPKKD
ncbi:DUF6503 family protein [Aequorivita flava]|uniref:DUF6503 family protein n=1 Tax=Aequorivita flava TaxID=3114371 RepID=A0AB35YQG4_9FLAO